MQALMGFYHQRACILKNEEQREPANKFQIQRLVTPTDFLLKNEAGEYPRQP